MTDQPIIIRGRAYSSVAEAARDLGVSRQQVYRWLARRDHTVRKPSRAKRRKLTSTEMDMLGGK